MSARTVLIGVDGATFDILDPLMADGLMGTSIFDRFFAGA